MSIFFAKGLHNFKFLGFLGLVKHTNASHIYSKGYLKYVLMQIGPVQTIMIDLDVTQWKCYFVYCMNFYTDTALTKYFNVLAHVEYAKPKWIINGYMPGDSKSV